MLRELLNSISFLPFPSKLFMPQFICHFESTPNMFDCARMRIFVVYPWHFPLPLHQSEIYTRYSAKVLRTSLVSLICGQNFDAFSWHDFARSPFLPCNSQCYLSKSLPSRLLTIRSKQKFSCLYCPYKLASFLHVHRSSPN